MTHNNNDSRILKTKRSISFAFISLLVEKDFDSIHISEICEKAGIIRATFYNHYKDKFQLMEDIIITSCEFIHKSINNMILTSKDSKDIKNIVGYLLESLSEIFFTFKDIFKKVAVYQNNPIYIMVEEIAIRELKSFLELIKSHYNLKYGLNVDFLCGFIIGGSIDEIITWAKDVKGTKSDFVKGYKELIRGISVASSYLV